jgi:hypothetical protein
VSRGVTLAALCFVAAALSACSNRDYRFAWFQACTDAGFTLPQCEFLWAERRHSDRNSGVIYEWR